jgi:hypothetical protein
LKKFSTFFIYFYQYKIGGDWRERERERESGGVANEEGVKTFIIKNGVSEE